MSLIRPGEAQAASLTEQAAIALRREIVTARLPPGETLSEAAICERLSFSKAPVRAALARLAGEGLVSAVPRRGWVVALVTVRDIHEVFDLRLLLEPEAARRATGRIDRGAMERLDAVCRAGYRTGDADSTLAYLDANRAFHVAVAALAGNGRMARQVGRLIDESTRLLVLGLSRRDRSGEMAQEHRDLIDAMAEGRADAAAAIMRDQVAASRDMVLAALTGPDAATVVTT